MRPFTLYGQVLQSLSKYNLSMVDIINKIVKTDRIFLLGGSQSRRRTESIFNTCAPTSYHFSGYYFLVLISRTETPLHELEMKIERLCGDLVPVTAIVMLTDTFEGWWFEGHKFAAIVFQSGSCIYDAGTCCEIPLLPEYTHVRDKEHEKLFSLGFGNAKEFLAGAELYVVRNQPRVAAFMLHQSAEQVLRTLLKMGTGYHSHSHNIERLLRCASLVAYQLPDVFATHTERNKKLLQLLQSSYIDSRYKEGFKISHDELSELIDKVRLLHVILENTWKNLFQQVEQT